MQTFDSHRGSISIFFSQMHYYRRLYSEVLGNFQKAGDKRNYHLFGF